jgi:hypothetical protein
VPLAQLDRLLATATSRAGTTAPNTLNDLRIQVIDGETRGYFDEEAFPRLYSDADSGPAELLITHRTRLASPS